MSGALLGKFEFACQTDKERSKNIVFLKSIRQWKDIWRGLNSRSAEAANQARWGKWTADSDYKEKAAASDTTACGMDSGDESDESIIMLDHPVTAKSSNGLIKAGESSKPTEESAKPLKQVDTPTEQPQRKKQTAIKTMKKQTAKRTMKKVRFDAFYFPLSHRNGLPSNFSWKPMIPVESLQSSALLASNVKVTRTLSSGLLPQAPGHTCGAASISV